jgi:hypothetical protein
MKASKGAPFIFILLLMSIISSDLGMEGIQCPVSTVLTASLHLFAQPVIMSSVGQQGHQDASSCHLTVSTMDSTGACFCLPMLLH